MFTLNNGTAERLVVNMIFLDSSFYIALVNANDGHYDRSADLLNEIKVGSYGSPYTSNYIMAESAIVAAVRTNKNQEAIEGIRSFFMGENVIATMLRSNEELENNSWDLFCKVNVSKRDQPMSYVDCTNVVFAQHYHIGMIISFDAHFEGWLKQVT